MHASPFPARTIFDQTHFSDDVEHKFGDFDDAQQLQYTQEQPFMLQADHTQLTQMLQTLSTMRQDGALCDVVINVSGTKFQAHKAVLCSCSRWLRSLIEHEEEEIQLDMLDAESFAMILDYIYAQPVEITESNVDALLSIARRLGLQQFEQRCWSFLLMIVNPDNCMKLHELADKYECAPLKLSAWKIIQESYPGYAVAPARLLETRDMLKDPNGRQDDESSLGEDIPSIFAVLTEEDLANYVPPGQLPEGASAETVVKSWAIRLQLVWQECYPGAHELDFHNYHQQMDEEQRQAMEADPSTYVDFHEELTRFYMVHNPDKLRDVPEILSQFVGKEEEMLLSLYQKYNVELPPDLDARIQARHNGMPFQPNAMNRSFTSPRTQHTPFTSPPYQTPHLAHQGSAFSYHASPASPAQPTPYSRQQGTPFSPQQNTPFSPQQNTPFSPQQNIPFSPQQAAGDRYQPGQPHPSGTGIEQFRRNNQPNPLMRVDSGAAMQSKPSFRNNAFGIDIDGTVETASKDDNQEGAQPKTTPMPRPNSSRFAWSKSQRSMQA